MRDIKDLLSKVFAKLLTLSKKFLKWILGVALFAILIFIGAWSDLHTLTGIPTMKDMVLAATAWGFATAYVPANSAPCAVFNPQDWQIGQGLLIESDKNVWHVATSAPNGHFRYNKAVPLDSDIELIFIPLSEKEVNFVLTMHGIYEIIVGDGGYQGVTVKTSHGESGKYILATSTNGDRRSVFKGGPLEYGADVNVVIQQGVSRLSDGTYELNLRLARKSYLGREAPPVFATYSFPLSPEFNYRTDKGRFSIGLKAASDESKVSAKILCVTIDEK